ncbi:MAG: hypothetical protein AB7Q00_03645 [Phycisphaerales bacterium]|nr:MAG: hypothetical protein IPK69_08265 [Phycisphaerales bacterium]
MRQSLILGGVGVLVAGLFAGCNAPPRGEQSNRVEITQTTRGELGSRLVTTTELSEFRDQVVQQLTADLKEVPELNVNRVSVVFGDLENKTGIVPTQDFEAFRSSIRAQLMQSRTVLQNIRFVRDRQSAEALMRRESPSGSDILQEGSRSTVAALNPEFTYFLNGEMYRVSRGGDSTQLYSMSFNLQNMATGELVWSSAPYESKRVLR